MALKRKSDAIEAGLLLDGSDNVTSIEGAGEPNTLAPTLAAAPVRKRRKVATSTTPSTSTSAPSAKKRGRPASKAPNSRPATSAAQSSTQWNPPIPLQPLNNNYTTATPVLQGALGHTTESARDDTVLDGPAQSIETGTYDGLPATQPQSDPTAASSWNVGHANGSLMPIESRDTHPHADLVLELTEEINQLEETNSKLTAANQACTQHNNNLYREKLSLSQENAALKRMLREHAPSVQLPKVNVGPIDASLVATSHSTSLHSRSIANAAPSATSNTIDLTQDETRPLPPSKISTPLSKARASNPELLQRSNLRTIQSLTHGQLQHKCAQLQFQYDEIVHTKDALMKQLAAREKHTNTNGRTQLANTQGHAEVTQLRKEIAAMKESQDNLRDAAFEYARIERYLTGLCIRYKDLMSHLEKNSSIWDAVEAAKATWLTAYEKRNEGQLIDGDIASGAYQTPDGFTLEAGTRGSGGPSLTDASHHIISIPGDRNHSFASTDSGAFGLGSESTAPATVVPEEVSYNTLPETAPLPATLFPRLAYDGNNSSPEFADNPAMQAAGGNTRPMPQTNIFEDGSSMAAPSNTLDYENLAAILQNKDNAGTYHGDGTGALAEVGTAFIDTSYPNSTQIADLDSLGAHLQNTWDDMDINPSTFETENMSDNMVGQPTAGHATTYYQPEGQTLYDINPDLNSTSGNHGISLPGMPGGFDEIPNSGDAGNPEFDDSFGSYTSYLNGYGDEGGDTLMSLLPEALEPPAN